MCIKPNITSTSGAGNTRWRSDNKCGAFNPLSDGTPAECDPDGEHPCCNAGVYGDTEECGNREEDCKCPNCVDYKLLSQLRKSENGCDIRVVSGFLKNVCWDETNDHIFFKCTNSDVSYERSIDFGDFDFDFTLRSVSAVCENDPSVYQACGFNTQITNTGVLCGGYFCSGQFIIDSGKSDKFSENENCFTQQNSSAPIPPGLCDDKCDVNDFQRQCEDESVCNDYSYGVNCTDKVFREHLYLPVHTVCDGESDCADEEDEEGCDLFGTTAVHTCTHYRKKVVDDTNMTVPILDHTRCSVFDFTNKLDLFERNYPYCLEYLDQTNCSDIARVGGYCKINGFMSSVSKFVLCFDYDETANIPVKLCDDDFQNTCISPSTTIDCKVHKHRMCDGVDDCPDRSDEINDMCDFMISEPQCERRFGKPGNQVGTPVSWIMDGERDCLNGLDERLDDWNHCGNNKTDQTFRFELDNEDCQNVYLCPDGDKQYVRFQQLCDGVESCGISGTENEVCRVARNFPIIDKITSYNSSVHDVCQDAICTVKEFKGPWGDVFGVTNSILSLPTSKVDCSNLFGEYYLFLSCMDLCKNAACPLQNSRLLHDSCPRQYPDRVYTLADNSYLTFVTKSGEDGQYHQDYYQCNNGRCIEYKQVCDLFDDCGDMSDELNCTNHMICEDTLNSTKHQFISLSQRCDGIYDCFDLSDECNKFCQKEILGHMWLKIFCWIMGFSAALFNAITVYKGMITLKKLKIKVSSLLVLYNKVLITLIGCGDFLVGIYLIGLSIYDTIVYRESFCKRQAEWLTGTICSMFGVISTIGQQVSLFSMTALSLIRMVALYRLSLTFPRRINKNASIFAGLFALGILMVAVLIAVTPLVPSLEDYFVQGMYYDPAYKIFIGFPNKERHVKVLEAYYRSTENYTNITSGMTWKDIGEQVNAMFSQQYGILTRRTVHFYGNDGVCLFKYFVRTDDARRSRQGTEVTDQTGDLVVWGVLAVNLLCFIFMTIFYIEVNIARKRSSSRMGQDQNRAVLKQNFKLQKRISSIVATDFLCWVPFIVISGLHNLKTIDATHWYLSFAMLVLPLNSVINPLIYDLDSIRKCLADLADYIRNIAAVLKSTKLVSMVCQVGDSESTTTVLDLRVKSSRISNMEISEKNKTIDRQLTGVVSLNQLECVSENGEMVIGNSMTIGTSCVTSDSETLPSYGKPNLQVTVV